jgi:hypothetical protein
VEGCTYDFVMPSPALINSTMKPHKKWVYHLLILCLLLPERCLNESNIHFENLVCWIFLYDPSIPASSLDCNINITLFETFQNLFPQQTSDGE